MTVIRFPDFSEPLSPAPAPALTPFAEAVALGNAGIAQAGVALSQADYAGLANTVAGLIEAGRRTPGAMKPELQAALESQLILFTAASVFSAVLKTCGMAPPAKAST